MKQKTLPKVPFCVTFVNTEECDNLTQFVVMDLNRDYARKRIEEFYQHFEIQDHYKFLECHPLNEDFIASTRCILTAGWPDVQNLNKSKK